jgi:cell division protein FtsQ
MKNSRVRNQRVSNTRQRKQQHLLEVTVRHDKAVAQRNRAIFFFTCKLFFFSALIVGVYVGGREALRRFFWENPDYFLSDVRVDTDGSLTREQVLAVGGIREGKNIFTVDLGKAQEALLQLPQAERVEVQRVLPNRVNITISERRPIAWVISSVEEDPTSSDHAFLIDARSVVMRTKVKLPEYLHLPVISGVAIENLAPGQRVMTPEMQAALELIRLNADSTRFQVRNVDLAKGYCLRVRDRSHAQVTFGLDRVEAQLDRLNRLLDHLEPARREIQTVNLLVERNMPVTFVDPSAAPASAAARPDAVPSKSSDSKGDSKGDSKPVAAAALKPSSAKPLATPTPVVKAAPDTPKKAAASTPPVSAPVVLAKVTKESRPAAPVSAPNRSSVSPRPAGPVSPAPSHSNPAEKNSQRRKTPLEFIKKPFRLDG